MVGGKTTPEPVRARGWERGEMLLLQVVETTMFLLIRWWATELPHKQPLQDCSNHNPRQHRYHRLQ